jgi:hypothetical protein
MLIIIGPTPNLYGTRRTVFKKYVLQSTPAPGKPLAIYRIPRMPTEKEVADVLFEYYFIIDHCWIFFLRRLLLLINCFVNFVMVRVLVIMFVVVFV